MQPRIERAIAPKIHWMITTTQRWSYLKFINIGSNELRTAVNHYLRPFLKLKFETYFWVLTSNNKSRRLARMVAK
jgi:hypothetical protein